MRVNITVSVTIQHEFRPSYGADEFRGRCIATYVMRDAKLWGLALKFTFGVGGSGREIVATGGCRSLHFEIFKVPH